MRIGKYILLIASLVWTLWFVFAGFGNIQDPLYWLYKYEHLEGGWMAAGTLLVGGGITHLFGAQLLPLRIAGWLCVATAITLPYCCLQTREQRQKNIHWLALAFLLMNYGTFQEFSPGTLSVLLLSALLVTQSPVIAGLAIAARFPNILVLLILIPLWRKKNMWNIPIMAITAGLIYCLSYWLIAPAPMDAAMNSHEILRICSQLWEKGGLLIGFILMAVGVWALGQRWPSKWYIVGVIVGLALAYYIVYATPAKQWYNINVTYLLSAFCIVAALFTRNKTVYYGLALLVVASLGTDTAWLKLFPAVLCLLPLVAEHYSEMMRRYVWLVMLCLAVTVAIRFSMNSVGGSNLYKANTPATMTPYTHILINEREQMWLEQVKADYDTLQSPVLALGQRMHLIRAVTDCEAAKYNEFWSNIFDSVYTAKYREVVERERPIVFCSFSPQFKTKPIYKDGESAMEKMLCEEGYHCLERRTYKYMIYIPDYDSEVR